MKRALRTLALSAVLLSAATELPPVHAATGDVSDGFRTVSVKVKSGDTLLRLAARHGVTLDELRHWNPRRIGEGDLIKAGDTLQVKLPVGSPMTEEGPEWEGFYDIKRGDSLGQVAHRLGVTIADLRRWNGLRVGKVIRAGDTLKYRKRGPKPKASSPGRTIDGRLVGARHLGKGNGYRLRFPRNAYGLPAVNKTLKRCAARVAEKFPGTADILIGDISRPTGGHFPPHQSHQSGRDADVGYYLKGNKQNVTMHRVGGHEIDFRKTWTLLHCYLTVDRVVRVYMDRGIQRSMSRYLADRGLVSKKDLARLFQVRSADPEGDSALILHSSGHDTHLHVRFACEKDDTACEEEAIDRVFRL